MFKVGDRVKLVNYDDLAQMVVDNQYWDKIGTVVRVRENLITVLFDHNVQERNYYPKRFVKATKLDKLLG